MLSQLGLSSVSWSLLFATGSFMFFAKVMLTTSCAKLFDISNCSDCSCQRTESICPCSIKTMTLCSPVCVICIYLYTTAQLHRVRLDCALGHGRWALGCPWMPLGSTWLKPNGRGTLLFGSQTPHFAGTMIVIISHQSLGASVYRI